MHVSLDSALGRQRRLNSVGESVLQIAPSAAAAYSLRSLTGGDPKVVRVRRDTGGGAGDNDEEDFTVSEINSGALVNFVGSGNDGFVETWYDQSGNSNDAVQATAGSQPKIVNAGSLLADGLTFDGSDDVLFTSSAINSTNIAIACVSKSGNNGTAGIISMLDGINDGHELLYLANKIRLATNNDDLNVTATITNQNLYFANYDGSTQTLSVNGTASTAASSRTISVTQLAQIGQRRGGNPLNGSIEELIIYTSDESANRTSLETNIAAEYGITLS